MLAKVYSASVQGLEAQPVTIEVNSSRGIRFILVGLPDNAVKESHERITAALENSGFPFPTRQITVNLAPANVRKVGSGFDLPIAVGILATAEKLDASALDKVMMVGELSLDGSLQPICGALPIAIKARSLGYESLFVPMQNIQEAAVVDRIKVYGVNNLSEIVGFFNGTHHLEPMQIDTREDFRVRQASFDLDFADVKGQENVKRAIEVAAAGGHNLIMIGPPGSGKSMMAKRIPGILPPLTLQESLETTQIHSVAGKLSIPAAGGPGQRHCSLIATRPFRSPHHTISQTALVGGGSNPQPGEISLAHNGVLFADELPEFQRQALEVLRQPLEDRHITVSRIQGTVDYPCNFMFVASMNPCPCGYFNHPTKPCVCTPGQISRYLNKISGPLMDRIDIQCEILPLSFSEMSKAAPGEPSATIRERVVMARELQAKRYEHIPGIHCNAQMTEKLLQTFCTLDHDGNELLRLAMERLQLSARAYSRILKVARTIADLDQSESILPHHLGEAIGYRNLDRSDWAERRT